MSEEIKDIFECLKKYANLTPDAIDDLYYLEGTIEDLQQKVEQLEKELTLMVEDDERSQETIIKQSKRIKQLENIIKEAIVYVKDWQSYPHTNCTTHNELKNLLNILNEGEKK